jgi:hypothetical protein
MWPAGSEAECGGTVKSARGHAAARYFAAGLGLLGRGNVTGTKRVSLAVVVVVVAALRSSASNRMMKISASMSMLQRVSGPQGRSCQDA